MLQLPTPVVAAVLFAGMLLFAELGRQLARRRARLNPQGAGEGLGIVDTAVLGLLGLLVAFSFSGASSRFDARRDLIISETNAIGTAYLRLDLLPADAQPELRDLFRAYVDSRIELYRRFPDAEAVVAALGESGNVQQELWRRALAAAQGSPPGTMLVVPALNDMFDIATERAAKALVHPPAVIFVMLFGLALGSGLIAGHGAAHATSRDWFRIVTFSAIITITFYVILDLEYPRTGAIRIEAMDQMLVRLRDSMN